MVIAFPRGIKIDINNVPEDFEDIIRKSFSEYTEGTSKSYTYQDKLAYIDRCRELLHRVEDSYEAVTNLIKERFSDNLEDFGEIMNKSDFLSIDFMEDCYNAGRTNLYAHYTDDRHTNDKIMELLVRVIKVVINY